MPYFEAHYVGDPGDPEVQGGPSKAVAAMTRNHHYFRPAVLAGLVRALADKGCHCRAPAQNSDVNKTSAE